MTGLSLVKNPSKSISQAVRVLGLRLQLHEVDDVDHPDFQVGQMPAHEGDGGERFQGGHIPTAGHDHAWRNASVVAGPPTDSLRCASRRPSCGAVPEKAFLPSWFNSPFFSQGREHGRPWSRSSIPRPYEIHGRGPGRSSRKSRSMSRS
jgi:hypothetical protein